MAGAQKHKRIRRAVPHLITSIASIVAALGLTVLPGQVGLAPVAPSATPTVAAPRSAASWAEWTAAAPPPALPSAVMPTATPKVVYVRLTAAPLPTYTPVPTLTRRESIWREGDCWYLDLMGVSGVWVDGRPVAPAYGGTRACGSELTIR